METLAIRTSRTAEAPRPLLIYLGRQGIEGLTREIALAFERQGATFGIVLSRQNKMLEEFAQFGDRLLVVDTFKRSTGALMLWRAQKVAERLSERIRADRLTHVVTLMPHVWSPLIAPTLKQAGARYATILHDARAHPGDPTASVLPILMRDVALADRVVTLSNSVAEQALRDGRVEEDRLVRLFHPAIGPAAVRVAEAPLPGAPWRFLFLGRIMAYKGLPLFVDAIEYLRAEGLSVEASVMGEGFLGPEGARLRAMGARVVNRWLKEHEVAEALATHHAVVLSHVEASQSGVAASAAGAGVPVVATPVGALREQIEPGVSGLIAARADARALKEALRELIVTPGLHRCLADGARSRRERLSPDRFVEALLAALAEIES